MIAEKMINLNLSRWEKTCYAHVNMIYLSENVFIISGTVYVSVSTIKLAIQQFEGVDLVSSCMKSVCFLRRKQLSRERNPSSLMLISSCLHVNGRLDRNNARINEMNSMLKKELNEVTWIDTTFMDDKYGDLV